MGTGGNQLAWLCPASLHLTDSHSSAYCAFMFGTHVGWSVKGMMLDDAPLSLASMLHLLSMCRTSVKIVFCCFRFKTERTKAWMKHISNLAFSLSLQHCLQAVNNTMLIFIRKWRLDSNQTSNNTCNALTQCCWWDSHFAHCTKQEKKKGHFFPCSDLSAGVSGVIFRTDLIMHQTEQQHHAALTALRRFACVHKMFNQSTTRSMTGNSEE